MLLISILFVIICSSFNELILDESLLDKEWENHMIKYGLKYSGEENTRRRAIFTENYRIIEELNAKNTNFTLKMNEFGHLDKHEKPRLITLQKSLRNYKEDFPIFKTYDIPSEYDWRTAGVVAPVQNQLQCGSCYAFSAVGAIESQFAIHAGVLPILSEQEIVDCSGSYGNYGCDGGLPENVYRYCMDYGLSTYSAYPYYGRQYECNRNNPTDSYKLSGFKQLTAGNEMNLVRSLYNYGPISIGIDANHPEFSYYHSGILDIPGCSSVDLDHAVLAVGYNLSGTPYLLVKNSWGTGWGLDGYFKIALFQHNMCGIATSPSFPIPLI